MQKAFYYMFKDDEWFFKFCGLYSLIILPLFGSIIPFLGTIMAFISITIMFGYSMLCIKAILENRNNIKIPIMDIKTSIRIGLKYLLSYLLILIAMFFIICVFRLFSYIFVGTKQTITLIMMILLLIFIIYLIIFFPVFNLIFAKTENIFAYFHSIKVFKLIIKSPKSYFIAVIFTTCLTYMQNLMKNNITFIVCSLFLLPYIFFVNNYIIANSIKPELIDQIK